METCKPEIPTLIVRCDRGRAPIIGFGERRADGRWVWFRVSRAGGSLSRPDKATSLGPDRVAGLEETPNGRHWWVYYLLTVDGRSSAVEFPCRQCPAGKHRRRLTVMRSEAERALERDDDIRLAGR